MSHPRRCLRGGFTLIELLVVVAIIALLVSILLPSLSSARKHAKTVVCGSNMHHIGLAMANYLFSSNSTYPASYLYPVDADGNWAINQSKNHPFGYLHWSYFLYDDGKVGKEAFQCPSFDGGGAPRTNPGLDQKNWEPGQIDQTSDSGANQLEDKQAPRMSYTANAALIPRNKFNTALSGGQRVNIFVRENRVRRPGDTIMVAEYLNNWEALGIAQGAGILSKSHRPINPFYHVGSGFNEYNAPQNTPGFIYGLPQDQVTYGVLPYREIREKANILDASSGMSQINAVGRSHPTANSAYAAKYGGSSNFLFADSHVQNMTVMDSVRKRKWGNAYLSLSGASDVLNMSTVSREAGNP